MHLFLACLIFGLWHIPHSIPLSIQKGSKNFLFFPLPTIPSGTVRLFALQHERAVLESTRYGSIFHFVKVDKKRFGLLVQQFHTCETGSAVACDKICLNCDGPQAYAHFLNCPLSYVN